MKRVGPSRRTLLKAGIAAPVAFRAVSVSAGNAMHDMFGSERLLADVKAYADAGNKQSGGAGDNWTADWTTKRLAASGFSVERQSFEVPYFIPRRAELEVGELRVPLVVQPIVVSTTDVGLSAPIRLADVGDSLDGAIALVRLPYRRWSTILDRAVESAIEDAVGRGAIAIILVTAGPTGEVLLLNTPAEKPVSPKPLALLAPNLAGPVIDAARHGVSTKLFLTGGIGSRPAANIVGRRLAAGDRWIVVSTPRSGWTDCVGERGPGIAIWLALAQWMPRMFPRHNLLFVNNSGHEYEYFGAEKMLKAFGPPPTETDFWMHLGANVATRDWHELPGRLLPLPSADPHRFLMVSDELVGPARAIFKGQPGLEMAYSSSEGTAGELSEIVKAGYLRHAGIFGAHRQHHAVTDKLETVAREPLAMTARGVRDLLLTAISQPG